MILLFVSMEVLQSTRRSVMVAPGQLATRATQFIPACVPTLPLPSSRLTPDHLHLQQPSIWHLYANRYLVSCA